MFRAMAAALTVTLAGLAASPADAQVVDTGFVAQQLPIEGRLVASSLPTSLAPTVAQQIQMPVQMPAQLPGPLGAQPYFRTETRPSWVLPMHVVTAVMQGLDAHSTMKALNAGASEGNPIVSGVAGRPGAFTVVKAGVAAGVIFATEKMARRHPVRAFVTAVAINSAYAMIAAHNYRVAGAR